MNNLIKISNEGLVSARELYLGLGLNKAHWSRWYPTNIEKNDFFKENLDWTGFTIMESGNETMDFVISIEFAKHIAMMARTEKSHEYRNYFIKCEETLKNGQAFDNSQLSPETQLLLKLSQSIANNEIEQKKIKQAIEENKQEIQYMRDVITLSSNGWRKDTTALVNKIAFNLGGYDHIKAIREESYKSLNERFGVDVKTRLTNKRRRMADEGVCKSKRDKLTVLDIIADDKKLIEGYVAIIKDMAIKHNANLN